MNQTFAKDDNLRGAKTLEDLRIPLSEVDVPALAEVHAYWLDARGEKFAPTLQEFKLHDLAPAIIPYVTIVDFEGPPFDYRFRFYGTKIVEVSGLELTGKRYNADMIEGFGYANAQVFPVMIETRQPIVSRTTWLSVKSIRYVSTILRLPLSADGTGVSGGVTVYHFG